MRTLTTALLVLMLVLGGVALAIAADGPQENTGLSGLQKLTDQEAREVRGLGMEGFGPAFGFGGYEGLGNSDCHLTQTAIITTAPATGTRSMYLNNGTPSGIMKHDRDCPPAPAP